MNSKKAKEIRRKAVAKNGGEAVPPNVVRAAKKIYTRQGNTLAQNPKLKQSRRQQRLTLPA